MPGGFGQRERDCAAGRWPADLPASGNNRSLNGATVAVSPVDLCCIHNRHTPEAVWLIGTSGRLVGPPGLRRSTLDELDGEGNVSRSAVPPVQRLPQVTEAESSGFFQGLPHSGQLERLGDAAVVETNHRDILGYAHAAATAFEHNPGREDILMSEDCIGEIAVVDHPRHGGTPPGDVVTGVDVSYPIWLDAVLSDCTPEAVSPQLTLR